MATKATPGTVDAERITLARSTYEGERIVDRNFSALSKRCGEIVRDVAGDGPVRAEHYPAIMARIDRELRKLYPETPGATCLLEEQIVRQANVARARGLKVAAARLVGPLARVPEARRELNRRTRARSDA